MSLQFEGQQQHWAFVSGMNALNKDEWNTLVDADQPFLRYEFLSALEQSGAVSAHTGWQPVHYVARSDAGDLLALAPTYLKSHSYGEYVFDWAWADAYQRHGLDYYPKLLNAVPFTPCQGPRVLSADLPQAGAPSREQVLREYQKRCIALCQQKGLSSAHLLFTPDQDDCGYLYGEWLLRQGVQYHWYNRGYNDFAEYLAAMTSRRRKSIKKERARLAAAELNIVWRSASELDQAHLQRFYTLYASTYMKRGQRPYLSFEFFALLAQHMPEAMQFVFVYDSQSDARADRVVAGALFFTGNKTLYGRYWGCLEEYDALHFEVCYYQGIEYCLRQGLQHFDAGAQGEHKLARGFEPIVTHSYHYLREPAFAQAVADFLRQEAPYLGRHLNEAQAMLPFKDGFYQPDLVRSIKDQ